MLSEVFPDSTKSMSLHERTISRRILPTMSSAGRWKLIAVDSVREAIGDGYRGILCLLLNPRPVVGDWWTPGCAFIPLDVQSSWDDELFARTDRIVTDGYESFVRAVTRIRPNLPVGEKPFSAVWDVMSGKAQARRDSERAMLIVSGVASTDMVLGWRIYRRALDMGLGQRVRLSDAGPKSTETFGIDWPKTSAFFRRRPAAKWLEARQANRTSIVITIPALLSNWYALSAYHHVWCGKEASGALAERHQYCRYVRFASRN